MKQPEISLRERTRRAVAKDITHAAHLLFVKQGYEATTIDEVAAAVGMSQRSVFRYFATKEDIVLGKLGFTGDEMLSALDARPLDEPVWTSLRRMFDVYLEHSDEVARKRVAIPIRKMIFGSSALLGSYLQKLHQLQDATVEKIIHRAEAAGHPYGSTDPAPRALTAAAFGCLVAAQHVWLAGEPQHSFEKALDRAMASLTPSRVGGDEHGQ